MINRKKKENSTTKEENTRETFKLFKYSRQKENNIKINNKKKYFIIFPNWNRRGGGEKLKRTN